MASIFICESCNGRFAKGWTDEEAMLEAARAFSREELIDASVVCDDCWIRMKRAIPEMDRLYSDG